MNLNDTLTAIAVQLGLSAADLITFAAEDAIPGWDDGAGPETGIAYTVDGKTLYALIRALKPLRVLEIGTYHGGSATHIATALEANGGGELTTIDISPDSGRFILSADRSLVTTVIADANLWLPAYDGPPFDFIFEDGNHSIHQVQEVYRHRERMLTPGGVIVSHDTATGVGDYIREGMAKAGVKVSEYHEYVIDGSPCGLSVYSERKPDLTVTQWTPPEGHSIAVGFTTAEIAYHHAGEGRPNTLHLPIIEEGRFHDIALANKRGLTDALSEYGCQTVQLDYLAISKADLPGRILTEIDRHDITLLITQLHGADYLPAESLAAIRAHKPDLRIVNWSGDSWRHSLTSPEILNLCRQFDLQLVAAPDVLPEYAAHGIRAAFWQIAYEYPVGELPDMPAYDVVFLANVISEDRRKLMEFLRSLDGISVGIYGDWDKADGTCQYDFGAGEALYKNAKIAIADNTYPEQVNYTSNRPIQALVAGGAILLHQHVPKMRELLGIEPGDHYIEWADFASLEKYIRTYLKRGNDTRRRKIVRAGQEYTLAHHTYKQRIEQLFTELLPEVSRA